MHHPRPHRRGLVRASAGRSAVALTAVAGLLTGCASEDVTLGQGSPADTTPPSTSSASSSPSAGAESGVEGGVEGAGSLSVQLIADRLGCPKPRLYRDALGLTEGDCTIDGAEVTITDWATTPTGDVRDYLTSTGDLGYHNLLLPDGWSVGSDDAAFIRDAHDQLGGDIIN